MWLMAGGMSATVSRGRGTTKVVGASWWRSCSGKTWQLSAAWGFASACAKKGGSREGGGVGGRGVQ